MADDGVKCEHWTGATSPISHGTFTRLWSAGCTWRMVKVSAGVVLTAVGINVVRTPPASCTGTWKDPSRVHYKKDHRKVQAANQESSGLRLGRPLIAKLSCKQQRHEAL